MRRVGWMSLVMGLGLALSGCTVEDEWDYRSGEYDEDKKDEKDEKDDEDEKDGCTLTMGYWRNHNVEATNPNQQIPWPIPEDTEICEQTALSWLHTPPVGGDAFVILVRQWIVAHLNAASGAAVPQHIADAMDAAADLLLDDCEITAAERNEAIELAELLDAYNNGLEGVPHCDDVND